MTDEQTWACGMHWSFSAKAWCGFFRSLENGRVLLRYELTWFNVSPEQAADDISAFCAEKKIAPIYIALNPEMFPKDGEAGETVSETFSRALLPIRKGSDDRINGWSRLRSYLQPRKHKDGTTGPTLLISSDCKYFLRTLPTLISDEDEPDDVRQTTDEFPANGARFYVMARPVPWRIVGDPPKPHPFSGAAMRAEALASFGKRKPLGSDNYRRWR